MTAAIDTRESREQAREIKFLADLDTREGLVAWARAHFDPDAFGLGPHRDAYSTSSLYFETAAFDVYRRRGSYGRSKYRIRRYGGAADVFLERKFRTERLLVKRRTTVALHELHRLGAAAADPRWKGYWFHRRLLLRRLEPILQLSYDRIARIGRSPHGLVRMTIDNNLRVLPMRDRAFLDDIGMPILEGRCVVEVKYRRELPDVFRSLAGQFSLAAQKMSKFRTGLRALDYPLPKDADEDIPQPVADVEREHGTGTNYFD